MRPDPIPLTAPARPEPGAIEVPVLKVFDGDGFLTRIRPSGAQDDLFGPREREVAVRFGFIDAPEMDQPGGIEASNFLEALIGGRNVWLNVLVKMDTGSIFDRHGRLVAVPFLQCGAGPGTALSGLALGLARQLGMPLGRTRNVELEMVLNGWAWVLDRYGPDPCYLNAQEAARTHRRGIWARDHNVPPWTHKGRKAKPSRTGAPRTAEAGCPRPGCGGTLIPKTGRFGPFLGCSNYPGCRASRSI